MVVIIFFLLVGFWFYNEVWLNIMVIGSYFGEMGSCFYYLVIVVFIGFILVYILKGGFWSLLFMDVI